MVVPVLPLYTKTLGVSSFANGFLFATYAIALFASAIPFGILSDKIGRKPFVLFGMFAMAGAFFFYALAGSYPMLVLARVLDGLTAAATWSAALALVGDRFEEKEMGGRLGWAMAAAAIGGIAGPLVGGVLSDSFGYRFPFYAIAVVCLLGGAVSVFLAEPPRDRRRKSTSWSMLRPVFTNRNVLLACLITLVTTMGLGLLEPTLPVFLEDKFGMSRTAIGMLFGVTMFFYAVASPVSGKLSDAVGRKKPILAGLALTAVFAPLVVAFSNVTVTYLMMGLFGASIAFFGTPSFPLITDSLPRSASPGEGNQYGTAFGLLNFCWSLGYALGPLLGGSLNGWLGLLPALLFYSGTLVVLIVVIALLLPAGDAQRLAADSSIETRD